MNNETQTQAQTENDEIDESIDDTQSNFSEETVDVESTEQDGAPTETEPKKSRNQNAKARLRRKLSEAEDINQQLHGMIAAQNERHTALETKLDSVINPPAARPDRVDFETEENYEDELYDWRKSAEAKEEPTPTQQEYSTQKGFATDEVREHWLDQVDLAEDKYSDFDKKLKAIPLENMTDIMTLSIMESDHAGDIAYFLGDNLPEAKRISKLKLTAQVKEIDKLGNKFQSNTSSAPAPIVPTAGADSPIADLSKMSMKDYAAYMNKKEYGG